MRKEWTKEFGAMVMKKGQLHFFRFVCKKKIPDALYAFLYAIKRRLSRILQQFFIQSSLGSLEKRRELIATQLAMSFDFTVRYGPFKGLKLSDNFTWSRSDIAPMLLGTYEQHVLEYISKIPRSFNSFIDLGAGDGFYAVGMLHSGLVDFTFAYEMNESSQKTILHNFAINGLTHGFEVRGVATPNFLDDFSPGALKDSLILADVEGYEFELFDEIIISRLERTWVIIEIHDFTSDDKTRFDALRARFASTHSLSIITTGSRDLDSFLELADFGDSDRWLLVSEGRPSIMKWLCCEPNIK